MRNVLRSIPAVPHFTLCFRYRPNNNNNNGKVRQSKEAKNKQHQEKAIKHRVIYVIMMYKRYNVASSSSHLVFVKRSQEFLGREKINNTFLPAAEVPARRSKLICCCQTEPFISGNISTKPENYKNENEERHDVETQKNARLKYSNCELFFLCLLMKN